MFFGRNEQENQNRNQGRRIVINADEVIINADRVIVRGVQEDDQDRRRTRNRRRQSGRRSRGRSCRS